METRSNALLVSIVGGLLLLGLLAFIYYLANGVGSFNARYQIRTSKDVSGLEKGSPVTMSGVPMGRIESLKLDPRFPGNVLIIIAADEKIPLHSGVQADVSRPLVTGDATLILLPSDRGPILSPDSSPPATIAAVRDSRNSNPAADAASISEQLGRAADRLGPDAQAKIGGSLDQTSEQTRHWPDHIGKLLGGLSSAKVREIASGVERASKGADRFNRSLGTTRGKIADVRGDIRAFGNGANEFAQDVDAARPAARSASDKLKKSDDAVRSLRRKVETVNDKVQKIPR